MAGHQRKQFVNQHIWNGQYMELQKIFQVPRKISLTFEVVNHNHQDYLCSTLSQSSESEYNSSFILLNNLSSSKESTFHSNLLISNAVSTNSKINRNLAREIEIITTKTLINIWKVLRSVNPLVKPFFLLRVNVFLKVFQTVRNVVIVNDIGKIL